MYLFDISNFIGRSLSDNSYNSNIRPGWSAALDLWFLRPYWLFNIYFFKKFKPVRLTETVCLAVQDLHTVILLDRTLKKWALSSLAFQHC